MRKEKEKRSLQDQSMLQYLLDEYILFVRDFTLESPLSLDQVSRNLQGLATPQPSGCFSRRDMRINAHVNSNDVDRAFFNLELERYHSNKHGGRYRPSAHAEGRVYVDNGQTYLTGRVTVAGLQFWGGILFALIVFGVMFTFMFQGMPMRFGSFGFGWIFPIFALVLAYGWYRMYQDRNQLMQMIESAATYENYHPEFEDAYSSYQEEEKYKRDTM